MRILLETNKAKLIEKDGAVFKSFYNSRKNSIQAKLLEKISTGYKETNYKDIRLRAIKYYGLDQELGIKMEYLQHGNNLAKNISQTIMSALGSWLTQLYRSGLDDPDFPRLHGDFHLNNGYLDLKSQFIVFYDPERRENHDYIEYDIYIMSHSIFINSLKQFKSPSKYLKAFVENLQFPFLNDIIYDVMNENLSGLSRAIKRKYSKFSKPILIFLYPVYKLYWKKTLKSVLESKRIDSK